MKVFKLLLVMMTGLSVSMGAFAYKDVGKDHKRFNIEKRIEKLTKKLDLTSTQASEVKSVLQSKRASMKTLRERAKAMRAQGSDRETIKAALKGERDSVKERTKSQLKAILNAEQFSKLEAMKERRKKKRDMRKEKKDRS